MELRAGIGSGWIDISMTESRIAKELYLDLEAGRGASRNVVVRSTTWFVLCVLFFYFSDLYSEETELQAKLSLRLDHHHLQHQCVEFFQPYSNHHCRQRFLLVATTIISCSNADT